MTGSGLHILSVDEFYTRAAELWPETETRWKAGVDAEAERLRELFGDGVGRSALDCTCGEGVQALALARLGWQVTGTDRVEESLATARGRAEDLGLALKFRCCDVRELAAACLDRFDLVLSCMALDNLIEDCAVEHAISSMAGRLTAGGSCFIRLRDFEQLMLRRPRYEVREERETASGRRLRLEDWHYEDDQHVVYVQAYLAESARPWETEHIALRRRIIRRVDLEAALFAAGLLDIRFLDKRDEWAPIEVIASLPGELSPRRP